MPQSVSYLILASLTHFAIMRSLWLDLYDLRAWRSLCILVLLVFMSLITSVLRFVERTYPGVSVTFPIGCQSVVCGFEYPQKLF